MFSLIKSQLYMSEFLSAVTTPIHTVLFYAIKHFTRVSTFVMFSTIKTDSVFLRESEKIHTVWTLAKDVFRFNEKLHV